ncbi:hypothetical protein BGX23_002957, partial [Mortierella sp. AD031]
MRSSIESKVRYLKDLSLSERPGIYVPLSGKPNLDAPDHSALPLMETVFAFLGSKRQVMLLLGDPGSSKSTFVKQLERELWTRYNGDNDPIPLLINLQDVKNAASDILSQVLELKYFSKEQRGFLKKRNRPFILICDGYDEAQVSANIYNTNDFNGYGQWRVKLIITCRSDRVGRDYRGRFQPEPKNRYDATDLGLFQEAAIAPFTRRQIKDYVTQYVAQERPQLLDRQMSGSGQVAAPRVRSEAQGLPPVVRDWSVDAYMEMLTDIPNLMDVVKNPFLLSITLKVLPVIAGPVQDLSRSRVSFDTLYKHIVDEWLEVGKMRLYVKKLSYAEEKALDELMEEGFVESGMEYMKGLAAAIFRKQGGNPVVQYSHLRDKDREPWKAKFLSPEPKTKLLQESVPLIRAGLCYQFIHPSLLEYLYSLVVFEADDNSQKKDPCKDDTSDDHNPNRKNPGSGAPVILSRLSTSEELEMEGTLGLMSISERPMAV